MPIELKSDVFVISFLPKLTIDGTERAGTYSKGCGISRHPIKTRACTSAIAELILAEKLHIGLVKIDRQTF